MNTTINRVVLKRRGLSDAEIDRATRQLLQEHELPIGTTLENDVTWQLHRWKALDQCQFRVGKYRLDYAWPAKLVALEADGPFHRQPGGAASDAVRDAYLRNRGWLVFRVDDANGTLGDQLARVVAVINSDQGHDWTTAFARAKAKAREAAKAAAYEAEMAELDRRIAGLDAEMEALRSGAAARNGSAS